MLTIHFYKEYVMDFQQGYIGVNKQGLEYEVLDGRVSKKTKIRFSIDSQEVVTTKAYLRRGLPMHPTYGKILVGDTFVNKQGLSYKVISKGEGNYWLIQFEDGTDRFFLLDNRDGSIEEIQDTIEELVVACGCKVIILDPLQDILDGLSNEEQAVLWND